MVNLTLERLQDKKNKQILENLILCVDVLLWWVRVVYLFSLLCCPIMCLYFLSSVL